MDLPAHTVSRTERLYTWLCKLVMWFVVLTTLAGAGSTMLHRTLEWSAISMPNLLSR